MHFGSVGAPPKWAVPFYAIALMAVPVFMMSSFALSGSLFTNSDYKLIGKRIYRLALPLVAWSAIYFCIFALIDLVLGSNIIYGVQDFFWQAFTGHRENINPSMWFQFDLIILSCISFACFRCVGGSKRAVLIVSASMVIFGLMMQYTGWNYALFDDLRYELKFPLGRLCETLPYVGIGLSLFCLLPPKNPDIAQCLPWKHSSLVVLAIGLIMFCVGWVLPWPGVTEGFCYGGLKILWMTIALYFMFNALNTVFISERVTNLIVYLSKYALGVYCIHRLVGRTAIIVLEKMDILVERDFFFACGVFVLSLVVCILASYLPFRWLKQIIT